MTFEHNNALSLCAMRIESSTDCHWQSMEVTASGNLPEKWRMADNRTEQWQMVQAELVLWHQFCFHCMPYLSAQSHFTFIKKILSLY